MKKLAAGCVKGEAGSQLMQCSGVRRFFFCPGDLGGPRDDEKKKISWKRRWGRGISSVPSYNISIGGSTQHGLILPPLDTVHTWGCTPLDTVHHFMLSITWCYPPLDTVHHLMFPQLDAVHHMMLSISWYCPSLEAVHLLMLVRSLTVHHLMLSTSWCVHLFILSTSWWCPL